MPQTDPLNPALYRRLERLYGEVRLVDEGLEMMYQYVYDPLAKKQRLFIVESGEQYRVNCPMCRDRRQRLYVSHRWGWYDSDTKQHWYHLLYCQNENCFDDVDNRQSFKTLMTELGGALRARQTRVPPRIVSAEEAREYQLKMAALPGRCVPIERLSKNHEAVAYLLDRHFNIQELAQHYKPQYCERVPDRRLYLAQERIIIPAYLNGRQVGWQARYVGEIDFKDENAPPKYFTAPGFKRGHVLYNFDVAKTYRTVVVVEGPTDVWSFGPMSVGIWGGNLTQGQKLLLTRHCKKSVIVILLDPEKMDDEKAMLKVRMGLEGHVKAVVPVRLPDGTDPGGLERDWLHSYVRAEASAQGVKVNLKQFA